MVALACAKDTDEGYELRLRGQQDLDTVIAEAGDLLASAEKRLHDLMLLIEQRRTFRFELEAHRFLHDSLSELLQKLPVIETKEKAQVAGRLSWARQIERLSLAHPKARRTWGEVRDSLTKADDITASKLYGGKNLELRDENVMGLAPIGMNPVTKLWEFYELRSAWDGKVDPKDIEIPQHDAEGAIQMGDDTGLVFVLLPGGSVLVGSQTNDPKGPGFDADAEPDACVDEVQLSPFFLSKYELTQGQWARLWKGDDRMEWSVAYKAGWEVNGVMVTRANPVEQVDWAMCESLLLRHGMVLPTEAQWEYGCRAGTSTPWLCAFDELRHYANVADETARLSYPMWGQFETWADMYTAHAPVGSFRANAFGLHDVHGNVWEWCRDVFGNYYCPETEGDGLRLRKKVVGSHRVLRGGSFIDPGQFAKSAIRYHFPPEVRNGSIGVRPARALKP